jgi:DNA-directed RNA polymerase specialized sigma54-like protein
LKDFAEKKLAGEFTYFEISALKSFKSLEINKWLQAADMCISAVEAPKVGEVLQRLQAVHPVGVAVEPLTADEAP